MRPAPIVEEIRVYREAKALEYDCSPEVAMKDFVRLHADLMKVRACEPSVRVMRTGTVRAQKRALAN